MDWATVAVRLALYLDLAALFGLPLFALYALRQEERRSSIGASFATLCKVAATLGIVLSFVNIAVMAKGMTGAASYTELQGHVFEMIVTGTAFGTAWIVRVVALFLCLLAALFLRNRPLSQFSAITGGAAFALATLAWGGHGAMDDGVKGYIHLASDIAHLIAAGAWFGALIAFVVLSRTAATPNKVALLSRTSNGFAQVGTMVVATLVVTGVVNYWMIIGLQLPELSLASYGGLLLFKLALFGIMLLLAAANRFHLSPQLEHAVRTGDHVVAVRTLQRSLTLETGAATLILVLVASLGILSPMQM
ncbi:MAG: copper homeostasis membrane protein CopD [Cupriavidus sp.]|uniref:copper homeostasis membrane protein CopD n=1 Tax=Cupriavidus sp. TaxID=1873897 RepID=UPI0025C403CC|nr:copper homeostasis membrane protein CopD [Cupriavidus sp.]MCA3194364.1 copper homeostasis membrane protein CopD [Cupriavidus sp.]